MVKLYIVRGLPGSGKSTKNKKLLKDNFIDVYYEADMYFYDNNNNYNYDRNKIKDAHQWCKKKVFEALMNNKNVGVSNTFIKKWEYKDYVDFCTKNNIEYEIIVCNGNYKNIHGVPCEVVERMKNNFET